MKIFRGTAAALVGVALIGLAACGGGDSGDDAAVSADTTRATTATTTSVTTSAASHASPCLSNEEVAAITGTAPESSTSREHSAKKWPNGDCRYEWQSLNVFFNVTLEYRSDTAQYFETTNARTAEDKYTEVMTPPAIGDKAFLSRSTGRSDKTGLNGIMRVIRGPLYMSANYTDYDNKLRPSLDASVALFTELMKAHLAKMPAAQP